MIAQRLDQKLREQTAAGGLFNSGISFHDNSSMTFLIWVSIFHFDESIQSHNKWVLRIIVNLHMIHLILFFFFIVRVSIM